MAAMENALSGQSTMNNSKVDLDSGPIVVVPPKRLMDASETARSIKMAEVHLVEIPSSEEADICAAPPVHRPSETFITDRYAFAFDIDGVLIRGGKVIPEAVQAMKMLDGENQFGIKV